MVFRIRIFGELAHRVARCRHTAYQLLDLYPFSILGGASGGGCSTLRRHPEQYITLRVLVIFRRRLGRSFLKSTFPFDEFLIVARTEMPDLRTGIDRNLARLLVTGDSR